MARRGVIGLLGATGMALLAGCGLLGSNSYRFRMVVEVETQDGLKSGSSVYEVRAGNTLGFLPEEAKRDWAVKGEAVAVDLPDGKTLFALLKTNAKHGDMASLSMQALDPAFKNDIVESAMRIEDRTGVNGSAEVPIEIYPMLVTFTDIADPSSVKLVDPADLAASYGPGVKLKRITVEITDDPVTSGIEKRLGWLEAVGRQRGTLIPDPPRLLKNSRPIHLLAPSDFTSELYK